MPVEMIVDPAGAGAVWRPPEWCPPHRADNATHDQANHAPNENMEVEGFFRGIRTQCRVFEKFAALR